IRGNLAIGFFPQLSRGAVRCSFGVTSLIKSSFACSSAPERQAPSSWLSLAQVAGTCTCLMIEEIEAVNVGGAVFMQLQLRTHRQSLIIWAATPGRSGATTCGWGNP